LTPSQRKLAHSQRLEEVYFVKTIHDIVIGDSRRMDGIADASIDLVVTSPSYPMIEMWDELFTGLSETTGKCLKESDGYGAFNAIHDELDKTWHELCRVVKPGGFVCINIGDATRTIAGRFRLYPNHSRIISAFQLLGFDTLPVVLWRKQTNAPNKFMGSGMLPAGAYVTLEHEYILIFRKGGKRVFPSKADKAQRMRSSFFWEERNKWFSDVWDFKGIVQGIKRRDLRTRSAAYPMELAYRIINMFSLYGDTILDPFLGTGTTTLVSIVCGRNSIGFELDSAFATPVMNQAALFAVEANRIVAARISDHLQFISSRIVLKGPTKYLNIPHGFPVVTRQETGIELYKITGIHQYAPISVEASYEVFERIEGVDTAEKVSKALRQSGSIQLSLDF
jgi:modification methylase